MPETRSNDALVDERPPRRRRRIWPWVLGIVAAPDRGLVVGGFLAAKFFDEAMDVRADLEAAKSRLEQRDRARAQRRSGAVRRCGDRSARATPRSADETVQGPLWEYASWVPFVGQNVAAVRSTTEATHILVRDALPASFTILGAMQRENIRFEGGGFNLEPFRQALDDAAGGRRRVHGGAGEGRGHRPRRAAADRRRRGRPGARGHRRGRAAGAHRDRRCCPPR